MREAESLAFPFFDLCPSALHVPLVALATVATVIASQSIITGAYSMTRQAIQLGLLPRIRISQTSAQSYGQIYVGTVNWALMALTLVLTATFRSSDNLAAAFGVAVSLTMLLGRNKKGPRTVSVRPLVLWRRSHWVGAARVGGH